jgi:hypothetical protein
MNFESPVLTRRAFLGGAGAAVAVTAAHSAVGPFFRPRPLEIAALIDDEYGLAVLDKAIDLATFKLRATITSSADLRSGAIRLLVRKASGGAVHNLPLRHLDIVQLPDNLLVFGRWNAEKDLLPLLRGRNAIFVDNPLLGVKLGQSKSIFQHPELSLVGMTSVLDPLVEHVGDRIRSGVMGQLQDVAITTRKYDIINRLEGIAVTEQISHNTSPTRVRNMFTSNISPGVLLTCSHGQLHVPFYSAEARLITLPFRLRHFASVARGDAQSAMSLQQIGDLAKSMRVSS